MSQAERDAAYREWLVRAPIGGRLCADGARALFGAAYEAGRASMPDAARLIRMMAAGERLAQFARVALEHPELPGGDDAMGALAEWREASRQARRGAISVDVLCDEDAEDTASEAAP